MDMVGCLFQKSRNIYIHIQQNIIVSKASFYIQQLNIYAASRNNIYSTSRKWQNCYLSMKCIHWKNIYLLTKHIFIQGIYIRSRNYIHFKEIIFIQGIFIHSRTYLYSRKTYSFMETRYSLKEIYSFKEIIFIQGNMFIQGTYIRYKQRWAESRTSPVIFIQQVSPATL